MLKLLENVVDAVKYAPWFTRNWLMRCGIFCALMSIVLLAHDAIFFPEARAGADFANYWTGALLAAGGHPGIAYDLAAFNSFQLSLFGSASTWKIYSYPPIMMLLCWPLAGLSFVHAWLIWGFLGIAGCAWSLSRLVGWQMAALATIGTPAALLNLVCGQNGYFTAVLLVWGISLVETRPAVAGVLLGMVCYKPQLGLLLPVALAAGGYWRTFAVTTAFVAFLISASVIALGPDVWAGFIHRMDAERLLLQFAPSTWAMMPTVFVMARLAGAGVSTAYLIQALSAVSAAAAVAALWRRQCPSAIRSAGLVVGIFLATPYAYDYDMIVLVFAAAWLATEAAKTGFLPWEKIAALTLLVLPMLSFGLAMLIRLQIGPILLWLAIAVILRRGLGYPSGSVVAAVPPAGARGSRVPV